MLRVMEIEHKIGNDQGTYALLFKCTRPFQALAGKLGLINVSAGYWIYVGSAFGPGGLRSRLAHHLKLSQCPHWHLDYIKSALQPMAVWATTDRVKREHTWAAVFCGLKGASRPIAGFGATDCSCRSHLSHHPQQPGFFSFRKTLRRQIPDHGPLFRFNPDDIPWA